MFNKIKYTFSAFLFFCFAFVTQAQTRYTYTENIAPVIYNKCSSCHHVGGIAPMPFSNYDDVKKHIGMITMAALDPKNRFMPPWMPDTSYSHFIDERTLTVAETEMIKNWIIQGMPQGNVAAEPELPAFKKGSQLGKPDLTVSMKESFMHRGDNNDEYRVFVLPTYLKEGHNVGAIEIVPGNPKIAHHIILGLDTTQVADKLDLKDERYGYEQYSGFGFYPTYDNWSGWVPGNKTRFFPKGISNYILPRSKVLLQMHYGPSPIDSKDSTVVNIFYNDASANRYIRGWVISPNDIKDGPFFIPANTKKTFHAQFKVVADWSLINVTPHAHWLGKKWEVFAVHPNGDTTNLIRINDWDFNWQNFFSFKKFVKLEKGTMIYCNGTFDNTEKNYRNPNRPLKNVAWGESAKDEMFLFYFAYVPYLTGDENMEIAGTINYLNAFYNKPGKKIALDYSTADNSVLSIKLVDDKGKTVAQPVNNEQTASGRYQKELSVSALKPGVYWCKYVSNNYTESKKVTID